MRPSMTVAAGAIALLSGGGFGAQEADCGAAELAAVFRRAPIDPAPHVSSDLGLVSQPIFKRYP